MADGEDSVNSYLIKDISFFGSRRRILLQNENGPCPLLAICNILLLRNELSIPKSSRWISFAELVEMVSNQLFDANSTEDGGESTSSRAANVRENLSSCLEILPRLNVGLDVNCKFAGTSDFEYTRELAVFDMLDIALFHGWIVSSQDQKAFAAFAHLSYNQVVERLIAYEEAKEKVPGTEPDPATDAILQSGALIKEFLDRTASQLSYEGLLALHETVRERQLAVFFRNSHFSAMLKYKGDLYLLCTDIAFAYSEIVWERLDEVDGDTSYCDSEFKNSIGESLNDSNLPLQEPSGTDADAVLAWQLMQEDLAASQEAMPRQPAATVAVPVAVPKAPARTGAQGPAGPSSQGVESRAAPSGKNAANVSKKSSKKSCEVQ